MQTLWQKGAGSTKKPTGNSLESGGESNWFYRFTAEEDRELDRRLIPYDIFVNIAQARMLHKIGVYDKKGFENISAALSEAYRLWSDGSFGIGSDDEDVHSAVEKFLTKKAGPDGARIHTGRSRNDQVLADMRLYMKESVAEIAGEWIAVAYRLNEIAEAQNGLMFAGLTHTQPAMPHSADAWAAGYLDLLCTDLSALKQAYEVIDQSPLGSAAGYGVPHIPIDREFVASELNFSRVQEPVAASQLSRGRFEMQLIDALSYGALTFNRMAADVVLFMHPSWSLVTLSDDQTSGSSIMPQKRNPDAWELIRGAYHDFQAARTHLSGVPANLTSGYHRDLQVVKKSVMAAVEQSRLLAEAVRNALSGLKFNEEAAKRTLTPELFATHRANELVSGGMPFREAYRKVVAELETAKSASEGLEDAWPIKAHGGSVGKEASKPKNKVSDSGGMAAGSPDVGIYRHTGAPGSGVPDYLLDEIKLTEQWLKGKNKEMEQMKVRLLGRSSD